MPSSIRNLNSIPFHPTADVWSRQHIFHQPVNLKFHVPSKYLDHFFCPVKLGFHVGFHSSPLFLTHCVTFTDLAFCAFSCCEALPQTELAHYHLPLLVYKGTHIWLFPSAQHPTPLWYQRFPGCISWPNEALKISKINPFWNGMSSQRQDMLWLMSYKIVSGGLLNLKTSEDGLILCIWSCLFFPDQCSRIILSHMDTAIEHQILCSVVQWAYMTSGFSYQLIGRLLSGNTFLFLLFSVLPATYIGKGRKIYI